MTDEKTCKTSVSGTPFPHERRDRQDRGPGLLLLMASLASRFGLFRFYGTDPWGRLVTSDSLHRSRKHSIQVAFLALSVILPSLKAGAQDQASRAIGSPDIDRLKTHVHALASPRMKGRRDDGAELARRYLIDQFKACGLEPLFDGEYSQAIWDPQHSVTIGHNVGAKLVGSDPAMAQEWVVLGVHFDHLGVINGVIFPGADDNASGVAMMLEVARIMSGRAEKPRRGIIFVGFDLEERGPAGEFGLRGSQYFAQHPPIGLAEVRLFVTADMLGRSLAGVCEREVFVLGSEREPSIRPWIRSAARDRPVQVDLLGSDVLVIDRSDYGPFRTRKVPYLFFTTGENPLYHSPLDSAETINYSKLTAISGMIATLMDQVTSEKSLPVWNEITEPDVEESVALGRVMKNLLAHREDLNIGLLSRKLMEQAIQLSQQIEIRNKITPEERARMIRLSQVVIFAVL